MNSRADLEAQPGPLKLVSDYGAGVLAICATSLTLMAPAVLGSESFFARDVLIYYWPLRTAWVDAISQATLPEWAPHAQSGLPLLGDLHAGALYPPHLLYALFSFPTAYTWLLFLHHVALGLGMFAFLRRIGRSDIAATAGAVVLMLSGYVAALGNAGPLMAGLAYTPWILWILAGHLSLRRRVGWVGLLVAAQSLTGDPQAVLFSALAWAVWMAWHGFKLRTAWAALLGTGLAGVIAAGQLLPAWEVLRASTRAAANPRFAQEFAFHPLRLLELAAPFPFGMFTEEPGFWAWFTVQGPGDWPFALSGYLGASAILLIALGARKSPAVAASTTLVLLGLLLALGDQGGLGMLLTWVPPFRFFRYPEKYLALVAIGFAILLATCLDAVLRGELTRRRLQGVTAAAVILTGASTLAILLPSRIDSLLDAAEFASRNVTGERVRSTLLPSLSHALGCAVLVLGIAWAGRRHPRVQRNSGWALLAVIGVDLFLPAHSLVMTAPSELYDFTPPITYALQRNAPEHPFRIMRDSRIQTNPSMDHVEKRAVELASLRSNVGGAFGIEEVAGYSGGFSLARWENVASALYEDPARLGAVFNGCLVLTHAGNNRFADRPGLTELGVNELGIALYRNDLCAPRIHAVGTVLPARDVAEAVLLLDRTDLDLRGTAIAENDPGGTFGPATVEVQSISGRHAGARVSSEGPGAFVVFATSYFPGWQAFIDGREAQLKPTNGATMGVRVPPGEHLVEFKFEHPGRWALWLSMAGLIAAMALLLPPGIGFRRMR